MHILLPTRAHSVAMALRTPATPTETLAIEDREVLIGNPHKVLFPQAGYTKLDVARYFVAVAPGALRASGGRPNTLVRYPNGIDGEFFFQKRARGVTIFVATSWEGQTSYV